MKHQSDSLTLEQSYQKVQVSFQTTCDSLSDWFWNLDTGIVILVFFGLVFGLPIVAMLFGSARDLLIRNGIINQKKESHSYERYEDYYW